MTTMSKIMENYAERKPILTDERLRFDWSTDERNQVKELILNNYKMQEIAEILGEEEYNILLITLDLDLKGEI